MPSERGCLRKRQIRDIPVTSFDTAGARIAANMHAVVPGLPGGAIRESCSLVSSTVSDIGQATAVRISLASRYHLEVPDDISS